MFEIMFGVRRVGEMSAAHIPCARRAAVLRILLVPTSRVSHVSCYCPRPHAGYRARLRIPPAPRQQVKDKGRSNTPVLLPVNRVGLKLRRNQPAQDEEREREIPPPKLSAHVPE